MKQVTILGFILMCLAQLYVPASMIFQNENIKTTGTAFKFKTVPVDPNDPFRGKYVRLDFAANQFKYTDTTHKIQTGSDIYVVLENDALGFAKIKSIHSTPPSGEEHYLKARARSISRFRDTIDLQVLFPFDRFYLEEEKAPEAERLYGEALRDSSLTTYARVYVLAGQATLDEVLVNEIPINQWVEEQLEN